MPPFARTVTGLGLALSLALLPSLATAASKAGKARKAPASRRVKNQGHAKHAERTGKTPRAGGRSAKGRDIAAVLTWLKAHIARSRKSGKPSDLASAMMSGLLQLSIPNLMTGHYALASTAHAMRTRGIPREHATTVARDMAGTFATLGRVFSGLAALPELKGQVGTTFGAMAILARDGGVASRALERYCGDPNAQDRASAFEAALETYRSGVIAFVRNVK